MSENLFLGDTTYPHTKTPLQISRELIDAEFENFFEFPTSDKSKVSSVSCKLFAGIILQMSHDRIEQLERELADGKLSRLDSECLRIGQQIQRAAGNLPEMFNIVIDIENGYGGVKLFNNAGDEFDFETDSDGLSYSIEKAINAAIKE